MRAARMILMLLPGVIALDPAVARQSSTITKAEVRSLPAPEVKRRVMAQLGSIVTEERSPQRGSPVKPLTDLSFVTRAYATEVPGLCQLDRLTIAFRPDGDRHGDADTPVSANGFRATRYFHFNRPPPDSYYEIADSDPAPDDRVCRNAKLWQDEFFTAPDIIAATDGYLLAHRVMDAVIGGNPPLPLLCNKFPNEGQRECADIVRELKTTPISEIERCETDAPEFASALCYRIFLGERALRILARPPLVVLRVQLDSLIALADERVD